MKLPTTKTAPLTSLQDYTVLLYGPSKVGKSSFCSHADKALFLSTEPGLNALSAYEQPIGSWPELLEALGAIAKGDHSFKTIVLDTVDNAFGLCQEYICGKLGIDHPADAAYGKGFSAVNGEFDRVLTKLAKMPYGLFLISHSMEKEVDTRTGKYIKVIPTLPGKAGKIVLGLVDIILYATIEVAKDKNGEPIETRVIKSTPSQFYDSGDRTGRLPETLPLDYKALVKAFNSK